MYESKGRCEACPGYAQHLVTELAIPAGTPFPQFSEHTATWQVDWTNAMRWPWSSMKHMAISCWSDFPHYSTSMGGDQVPLVMGPQDGWEALDTRGRVQHQHACSNTQHQRITTRLRPCCRVDKDRVVFRRQCTIEQGTVLCLHRVLDRRYAPPRVHHTSGESILLTVPPWLTNFFFTTHKRLN